MASDLGDGRAAFDRGAWGEAFERLSAADGQDALAADDLERLATAAVLTGRRAESEAAWERAHHEWTRQGDVARSAACAFWLAFRLLNLGEIPRGGGWVERAQRQLDESGLECVEHGYLRYCIGLRCVLEGDAAGAHAAFARASKIGARYGSTELITLARVGEGRCLIYLGEVVEGVTLLDEAVVSVNAREISPIAVGDVYCTVIDGCSELFDVRRATDWTALLDDWCESQPELVLYRGECLVHRAEILRLRGHWLDALAEATRVPARLAEPAGPVVLANAHYLIGEVHRVRGAFDEAEAAYREASLYGRDPQPGLAQLRLAQGQRDAAAAAIRRALDQSEDPVSRARLLPPYVEIALAGSDFDEARIAADGLGQIADELGSPYLRACAAQATGAVRLADGDERGALVALRQAADAWRDLEAPFELASTRTSLALACRAMGDEDGATLEFDAARTTFERLGAKPSLARLDELSGQPTSRPDGLTPREIEVLGLVAAGETNRGIATKLVISERTVDSHVRSIFMKVGVSTRAAATAYAYERGIV
ncbi:MAG: LuxR C-terminal-related transcriptional regulator [Acidimicrobiia bacterium]